VLGIDVSNPNSGQVEQDRRSVFKPVSGAHFGQTLDNLETVLGEAGFALTDVRSAELLRNRHRRFHRSAQGLRREARQAGCRLATTFLGCHGSRFRRC
jgi:hypothetical protein